MAVALYARVSTAKQAEKDLSIPDQLAQMRAWCKARGLLVAMEYVELGASATDDKRPVFQQMVSDAAVHDSQVFEVLLDQTSTEDGNKRAVYADSAYRSREHEAKLAADNLPSQICEKGTRGHPLTDAQRTSNRVKSTVRARVEHVFGAQAQMGGHIVRTIGLERAKVKIGMMNLVYNMKRLVQLIRQDRIGAPAMA